MQSFYDNWIKPSLGTVAVVVVVFLLVKYVAPIKKLLT